ncbi:hypothetical protein N7456_006971 [Penicillium angulare]|uniref:Protein kinase domain-containing protein n=1 Tax=Penicillium angulare TaxID=116970 RepID=A0A9W9KC65_9EURO|nr:hypothetical protein N7456_006971 [Penicillium angulare]
MVDDSHVGRSAASKTSRPMSDWRTIQAYVCRLWVCSCWEGNNVETLEGGFARSRCLPGPPTCPRIGCSRFSRRNQPGPNLVPPWSGRDSSYASDGLGWWERGPSHSRQDRAECDFSVSEGDPSLRRYLRPDNILWNAELKRVLIIDFHLCTLDRRPPHRQSRGLKRFRDDSKDFLSKRVCGMG